MVKSMLNGEECPFSMETQFEIWLSFRPNQLRVAQMHEWMPNTSEPTKSLERATEFFQTGKELYPTCESKKDFHVVYENYAKGIAHTPPEYFIELALGYKNLSEVLFDLDRHTECLQAIECCFSLNCPEESKFELHLRKIECLRILKEKVKAKEVYDKTLAWIETKEQNEEMKTKLTECFNKEVDIKKPYTNEEIDKVWVKYRIKKFNEEIPGASNAISLKYEESQGRHYVAERDIRPGEILMNAHPYAVVCTIKNRYRSCWECCRSITNCIPCDFCEQVIFCSEKCKDEAWEEYHHVECEVLPFLMNLPIPEQNSTYKNILVTAFRLMVIAIKEYGSIQNFRKAFEEVEPSTDPRTEGFSEGRLVVDKYPGLISLKSHFTRFKSDTLHVEAAIIYHIFMNTKLFGQRKKTTWVKLARDKDYIFAVCAFVRHLDIVEANCSNVFKMFGWTGGTGVLSLSIPASFLNHSCVANVFTVQTKEYTKVVAKRPIKKGEQIYLDYLGDAAYPKAYRKHVLENVYRFNCNCDSCINDWPRADKYPTIDDLPARYSRLIKAIHNWVDLRIEAVDEMDITHDEYIKGNKPYMRATLKELSKSIERLDGNVPEPCSEMYDLQTFLREYCMKLHGVFM